MGFPNGQRKCVSDGSPNLGKFGPLKRGPDHGGFVEVQHVGMSLKDVDSPGPGFPFGWRSMDFSLPERQCLSIAQAFGKESESGFAVGLAQGVTRKLSPSVIARNPSVSFIYLSTRCIVICMLKVHISTQCGNVFLRLILSPFRTS